MNYFYKLTRERLVNGLTVDHSRPM